jgi:hypothetical protein
MDSKKEVLAASILAISLALGLGTVSYSLFSETPTPTKQGARIDLFSERNGVSSISFLPDDVVLLEAELSYRNASVAGTPVTFDVQTPNNTEFFYQPETVTTNSDGIANITFQIPSPSEVQFTSLGIWQISAASEIYGQSLNVTADIECYQLPIIDVFTQNGGVGPNVPGGNFLLNGTVVLYAEVRDELNHTVPNQLVAFEILDPSEKIYTTSTDMTDSSGIATEIIRIPPPPNPADIGTFEVYATTSYYGTTLIDTLTFTVTQD